MIWQIGSNVSFYPHLYTNNNQYIYSPEGRRDRQAGRQTNKQTNNDNKFTRGDKIVCELGTTHIFCRAPSYPHSDVPIGHIALTLSPLVSNKPPYHVSVGILASG